MKKIEVGQAISILANFGVIVGIVFLAIEIRQNNQQLALQSYQAWVASNLQINAYFMDPEISAITAKGNADSKNLSRDSFVAHAMSHLALFQMAQSTDYLYRSGALDRELWQAEQVSPGFADFIESVQSDIATWDWRPETGYFRNDGLEVPIQR
jgi:hypothetical protein